MPIFFSEFHEELTMALIDSNIILNLQRLLNQVGSCLFNPVFHMSSHSSDPPLQHSVKNPAEMRAAALRVAPIGEGIRLWKDAGYYRMLQDVLLSA